MGQIFAIFANFGQIREIKSSRKILREPIRENKSTRNVKKIHSRKFLSLLKGWASPECKSFRSSNFDSLPGLYWECFYEISYFQALEI